MPTETLLLGGVPVNKMEFPGGIITEKLKVKINELFTPETKVLKSFPKEDTEGSSQVCNCATLEEPKFEFVGEIAVPLLVTTGERYRCQAVFDFPCAEIAISLKDTVLVFVERLTKRRTGVSIFAVGSVGVELTTNICPFLERKVSGGIATLEPLLSASLLPYEVLPAKER